MMTGTDSPETISRTIIVTGASGGIGSAIARRLLCDGYRVIGTHLLGKSKTDALVKDFPGFSAVRLDMADPCSIQDLVASLAESKIYGLINNAGIIEFEDIGVFDSELWRRVQNVNVQGVLHLCMQLGPHLCRPAAIVNVASTDAFIGGVDTMAYAASKAALISLTKSLAVTLGPDGIRVNAIAPGWIDTEMGTKLPEMAIAHTPLGRLGTPEDIAGIAAFLLSADSSFVTGATIVADGGYYCLDPVMKAEAQLKDQRSNGD